jgi:hypothetical protein
MRTIINPEEPRRASHRGTAPRNRVRLQLQERGRDLVTLRMDDVLLGGRIRPRAPVLQKKTCRLRFEITEQTRETVLQWITKGDRKPADYLPPKAALIDRRTGSLRAVQLLLGHTKTESTVRYLGTEVDDA